MKKSYTYLFLLILGSFVCRSQFDSATFIKAFSQADREKKVRLTASYSYRDIRSVFPLIRDSLIQIKTDIYRSTELSRQQQNILLLFDKIEFDKRVYEKKYREAVLVVENGLRKHASSLNDSLLCFKMLKNVNVKINNFTKAFEYEFLLQNYWLRKSDTANIDYGYLASTMYYALGLKTEAMRQRRVEFNKLGEKKSPEDVVNFYNDMGVFYDSKEHPDSAAFYFLKAKEQLNQINYGKDKEKYYQFYKGLVDGNLGNCYKNLKRYEEAISLLKNDVHASIRTKHYQSGFNASKSLVQCFIGLKDGKGAKLYLDTCYLLMIKEPATNEDRIDLLVAEAEYYQFVGDYKTATDTYRKYYFLNDSVQVLEKEKRLIAQGVALELERHGLDLVEKEHVLRQSLLQKEENDLFRIYIMLGFLVSIFIIMILIINNRSFKKRESQLSIKNEQIQLQHTQIEHTLKEKEALIKEIHHRVKNNLQIINSMLNLQIGKIQDEKTETILFEARQRINAIALTHQMLYQRSTISSINLSEYVETLVRQIEMAMSLSNITTVVQITPTQEKLTIDGAVPLGLIINELLTNAYKHAFPGGRSGNITVSLSENENSFTISVNDNGVGLPQGFSYHESKTLGMELVFILVEQLDSKLIVETTKGTTFKFDVKKHD